MKRFPFWLRAATSLMLISIALFVLGAVFFTPTSADRNWTTVVLLTLAIVLGIYAVLALVLRLAGIDVDSPDLAREISSDDPLAEALLDRWLRRSRYYRFMGGFLGLLVGLPMGSILTATLAGIAAGGAVAEIHFLRRRRSTTAIAALRVRRLRDYADVVDAAAMAVVVLGAFAVLIVVGLGHGSSLSAPHALTAVAVIVGAASMQFFVASRRRPAVRRELREADDLLRFLASTHGFARPAIALCFLLLGSAFAGGDPEGVLAGVSLLATVTGLFWWYRARHGRIPALARTRSR